MTDPFYSSRYSIEHAERHFHNLQREIAVFVDSKPYAMVIETNADGTEDFHKIKFTQPIPIALSGIAFDAFNNLRSCLDQAGYAVAIAAGKSGNRAHFPFGDNIVEVKSRIGKGGGSEEVPKEIFDLMVKFEPYKGGNNLLWALNKLCNSHKHEIITPIVMHTGSGMSTDTFFEELISFIFPPVWDRTKNEMVLAHLRHGTKYKINFQLEVFIALTNVDVVDGHPALGVIGELLRIVKGIIMAIEAEASRIGLFN
jgi:hypothetical protein